MPFPLSPTFLSNFQTNKDCIDKLKGSFAWDCVRNFENAKTYSMGIKNFQSFYENNYDALVTQGLSESAGTLFLSLQEANQTYELNQKIIGLFTKLIALAGLPITAVQTIQTAMTSEDTFALLKACLEAIHHNPSDNIALKQSITKALVTAYFLLKKPIVDEHSEYLSFLDFLLSQSPVDEHLLLHVLGLQAKIYSLAHDNLDTTQELLDSLLSFKEKQHEKNVPYLSDEFFKVLSHIGQSQNSDDAKLLDPLNDLDEAAHFFETNSSSREGLESYSIFVTDYTKKLLPPNHTLDSETQIDSVSVEKNTSHEIASNSSQKPTQSNPTVQLLEQAKQITEKTTGKSRQDIQELFSLRIPYYKLEKNNAKRTAFRAALVKKAVAGLKNASIDLPQYLSSAKLDSANDNDSYKLMHYQFFLAVIKEYAHRQVSSQLKAQKFSELSLLIKHIRNFAKGCSESNIDLIKNLTQQFQAQETAIMTQWFDAVETANDYHQSITALNAFKENKSEYVEKLTTAVVDNHLPSLKLLIKLDSNTKLLATPEFTDAIEKVIATSLTVGKENVHFPLILLLKVCLSKQNEKTDTLVNKIVLIFMALEKPSEQDYATLKTLLSQHERYKTTLNDLLKIQLPSFADYQALLCEAAKGKPVNRELIEQLFDTAMVKASDADELLSLIPACKFNPDLSERLVKTLSNRFPDPKNLNTWMKLNADLKRTVQVFVLTDQQCEALLGWLEKQTPPSAELNDRRKLIADHLFEKLLPYETQLILPDELLAKRYAVFGEQENQQVFVSHFKEFIQKIQENEAPASLKDLQEANTFGRNLLRAMNEEKNNVIQQYDALVASYQKNLARLVKEKTSFIQEIDKKLEQLQELYQQAEVKKSNLLGVFEEIQSTLTQNNASPDLINSCKIYHATITRTFVELGASKQAELEKLKKAKESQAMELGTLTTLLEDKSPLSPEKITNLRTQQRNFTEAQKASNQLATQIETQINAAQSLLLTQAMPLKNECEKKLSAINSDLEEAKKEQHQLAIKMTESHNQQTTLPIELSASSEKLANTKKTIDMHQELVKTNDKKLSDLSKQEESISKKLSNLYTDEELKTKLTELATLFEKAIKNRESQQQATFWRSIAEWMIRNLPDFLTGWAHGIIDDLTYTIPQEIRHFQTELATINGFINGQQTGTHNGKLRNDLLSLSDENLSIRNDQRAFFIERWWTDRTLDNFFKNIQGMRQEIVALTTVQSETIKLVEEKKAITEKIAPLQQKAQEEETILSQLTEANCSLPEKIATLQASQQNVLTQLNTLEGQSKTLSPLYKNLLSWLSSPLVEILYTNALNEDQKLAQLQEAIDKNSNSLLQDGTHDGVVANIVYHAARHSTAPILSYLLTKLPPEAANRYLTTPILEQGQTMTPLARAIMDNQPAKIDSLIKAGADVNQHILDAKGQKKTLLLWAYETQSQTVPLLIEAGADYRAKDTGDNTLLHYAAMKGDSDMILSLLERQQNPTENTITAKNQDGNDILALLMGSDLSVGKKSILFPKLLKYVKNPTHLSGDYLNGTDKDHNNLLHHAVTANNLDLVKWLLQKPTKELLNAKNTQKETPLAIAVKTGNTAVVTCLLSQSIPLDDVKDVFLSILQEKDPQNKLIITFLDSYQNNFIKKLTQADPITLKESSYAYLTSCANLENIKCLVEHGANPCATDNLGNTVLHHAVLSGDLSKVQYLVETCGVMPHSQNKAGLTPLMALYNDKSDLSQETRQKIIHYLVEKTSHSTITLLANQMETLSQQDENGNRLLHYAAKIGDIDTVIQLINQSKRSFGANLLNSKNKAGETAIHALVKDSTLPSETVLTILGFLYIEGNAKFNIADNSGCTPLDYATDIHTILFLIEKLPEKIEPVRLIPIGLKIMRAQGLKEDQKKESIKAIATANKIAKPDDFYRDVFKQHQAVSIVIPGEANAGSITTENFIHDFENKTADQKAMTFRTMIIGQKATEVACILDSPTPLAFPHQELNQAPKESAENNSSTYLSLTTGTSLSDKRRNFWVDVVTNRKMKELPFQDYATGYTLLHALVFMDDKHNFDKLNTAGVLYATKRDHQNKTVLMLTREKFCTEVDIQPLYTPNPTDQQSIYLSVLQSIERRLVVGFNNTETTTTIIAELDFTKITELEMLISMFAQLKKQGVLTENTARLWQLTDTHQRSLAESAVAILNQNPSDPRAQRLLVDLLAASGVEQAGQSTLGDRFNACKQALEDQINYFSGQSEHYYQFSEAELLLKVLNFDKGILEQYKTLSQNAAGLRKTSNAQPANSSNRPWSFSFFASEPETNPSSEPLLKENCAYNMVIFLGLFIEASGMDTLLALPSASATPERSLLAAARERNVPSLYVELVGHLLNQLNLSNPIDIIKQAEIKAHEQSARSFQETFEQLHTRDISGPPINPLTKGMGLPPQ